LTDTRARRGRRHREDGFGSGTGRRPRRCAGQKGPKELIALAIAISTHCDGCIGFHTEALVRLGATRPQVEETLGTAVYMGGGPSLKSADAISSYEESARQ